MEKKKGKGIYRTPPGGLLVYSALVQLSTKGSNFGLKILYTNTINTHTRAK